MISVIFHTIFDAKSKGGFNVLKKVRGGIIPLSLLFTADF